MKKNTWKYVIFVLPLVDCSPVACSSPSACTSALEVGNETAVTKRERTIHREAEITQEKTTKKFGPDGRLNLLAGEEAGARQ